jgi:GNAT superfamily N-acetyltransferase
MITFETRDAGLLRGLLESDRVAGAYLLGDLEAPFFEQGRWLVAARGGTPIATVLVFTAFADPVILSFGEVDGVEAIVAPGGPRTEVRGLRTACPERCYLKIPPEHEEPFARAFEILERETMKVMATVRAEPVALRPCPGRPRAGRGVEARTSTREQDIRRLTADVPVDRILDVYRSYPGHFFEPGQLTTGIYFGSFEGDRLVAVAGTHVYSPAARVAVVGNIVTAVDGRGRGHATACTAAVIDALRQRGCDTIVLHVAESNAPALACYRHLGFLEYGRVLQLKGVRKSRRVR